METEQTHKGDGGLPFPLLFWLRSIIPWICLISIVRQRSRRWRLNPLSPCPAPLFTLKTPAAPPRLCSNGPRGRPQAFSGKSCKKFFKRGLTNTFDVCYTKLVQRTKQLKGASKMNMSEASRIILGLRAAGWDEKSINDFILWIESGEEQYKPKEEKN